MKNPSSYLKIRVLAAIDYAEGKTHNAKIKNVANQTFIDEEGNPRKFTWRTISTWFYRYKNRGVTGLDVKQRSDKGIVRKVTPEELLEAINTVTPRFHGKSHTKMDIFRECIKDGLMTKDQLSQTKFYRLIRDYDLLDDKPENQPKMRKAFSMQYANDLWQADTMFGPYVDEGGKKIQAKLIAFIDDASRVICHARFYLTDTAYDLVDAFRSAIYKRGVPKQLYVDNGASYSSLELKNVCDRIGCILRFTPVRDAAAKGKIERFFHTVRMQFTSRILDLSSLDALNKQLVRYVEDEYNDRVHSAIAMKPIDRFALDSKRINFLSPCEENDELFYAEIERSVSNDNTFRNNNKRYETPVNLAKKKVQLRFDRRSPDKLIVYYKGQRMGKARPLNQIDNGNRFSHKGGRA